VTWRISDAQGTTHSTGHIEHVLKLQPFHEIAFAHAIRSGRARGFGAWLEGNERLDGACAGAKGDLAKLGFKPTSAMIDGYIGQFGSWAWPPSSVPDAALAAEARMLEKSAQPASLALLPLQVSRHQIRPASPGPILPRALYERWEWAVQTIVLARLVYLRAISAREPYKRLDRARQLPSPDFFRQELANRVADMRNGAKTCDADTVDKIVGASAAEASQRHLDALRWQLEVADLVLMPRGSFLDQTPKQLAVGKAVDRQIRPIFGRRLTNFAVSRIVSAALKVYGRELVAPTELVELARNAVEKFRRRMPPDLAAEVDNQVLIQAQTAEAMREVSKLRQRNMAGKRVPRSRPARESR
jgi:hypothetical protein